MKRLTKWNGKKWVLPQGRTSEGESYWQLIAQRLAAYENTGLEPWEIVTERQTPRGYYLDVSCGECSHRELWYGNPTELPEAMAKLRSRCDEWGWKDAIIMATEWERRKSNER